MQVLLHASFCEHLFLFSVSSNTFSVEDKFRIEEDSLDGFGDNDDGEGVAVVIEAFDGVDIKVGESSCVGL